MPASFFARPTLEVAPELLGAILCVEHEGWACSGRIVEVEAYLGQDDPASHAAGGPTPRSEVMFGPPGRAYVYLIYGMHHCLNFVTEEDGRAGAVLIRALTPLTGRDLIRQRRGNVPRRHLCDGPGKLCQALGIDRAWNGVPLDGSGERRLYLEAGPVSPVIERTPRIGISKGVERLYRFLLPARQDPR
ncbi:3-methyladenine DNA glycosylase [bacterium DOLJORAL78_65_58]|nr:MAG: 3-methyladenine DNA glycosylase [bacterium DOLZORAL124_64_63]PIE76227.1 MAG: 3-methyladenine DNA glycosylase [bacterium DOLJORAL78_65_58]